MKKKPAKKAKSKKPKPARKKKPAQTDIANLKRQLLVAERMRFDSVKKKQIAADPSINASLLASGIAHEFNNILGALDGHAEWALETKDPKMMIEALEVVRIGCHRSSLITRALQGLSQPNEEGKTLFTVGSLGDELKKIFGPIAEKASYILDIKLPADQQIYGNFTQLLEVFINLTKNAMEDTPGNRRGNLKISSKKLSKKQLEILFEDNAAGVPEVFQEEIFKPFFTTKGSLSQIQERASIADQNAHISSQMGSGLGLFLCRSILREHGGDISLKQSGPEGSSFSIQIPVP